MSYFFYLFVGLDVIRAEQNDELYVPSIELLQLPDISTHLPTEKLGLFSSSIYFANKGWGVPVEHHYNLKHT